MKLVGMFSFTKYLNSFHFKLFPASILSHSNIWLIFLHFVSKGILIYMSAMISCLIIFDHIICLPIPAVRLSYNMTSADCVGTLFYSVMKLALETPCNSNSKSSLSIVLVFLYIQSLGTWKCLKLCCTCPDLLCKTFNWWVQVLVSILVEHLITGIGIRKWTWSLEDGVTNSLHKVGSILCFIRKKEKKKKRKLTASLFSYESYYIIISPSHKFVFLVNELIYFYHLLLLYRVPNGVYVVGCNLWCMMRRKYVMNVFHELFNFKHLNYLFIHYKPVMEIASVLWFNTLICFACYD